MKTVLDELAEKRESLSTLRSGDDRGRLVDLLAWLETQPQINQVILEIRNAIDVTKFFNPHGFRPKTSNSKDIAAIGLYLLDKAKSGVGLRVSAMRIGVRPAHGGRAGQDYIDEALTFCIYPFLDFVEARLDLLGNSVTIENVVEMRFGLLNDSTFHSEFPDTDQELNKIAAYFAQSEDSGSWFHVAASCREVLGTFVHELKRQQKVTPAPELKQGDIKGILTQLAKERSDTSDALIELIRGVWVYVQSNVHRQSATKQEALRVHLWTGLLISEVWLLVKTQ